MFATRMTTGSLLFVHLEIGGSIVSCGTGNEGHSSWICKGLWHRWPIVSSPQTF